MKEILKYINIWLPSISVIASALISYFISKLNAKNEIKKIEMKFNREDKNLFNETFAKLLKNTSDYVESHDWDARNYSIETNSLLMTLAPKSYIPILPKMDRALNDCNEKEIREIRKQLIETALKEQEKSA